MTGNLNIYKTIWKNGNKKYNENTYAAFLRYEILKAQQHVDVDE